MIIVIAAVALLTAILTANTLRHRGGGSAGTYVPRPAGPEALKRFSGAIRIPTVSCTDSSLMDLETHKRFQDYLEEAFPLFHKAAERSVLSEFAVIYRWPGKAREKAPVLLTAHYDVVPVEGQKWTVSPFSGEIRDGYVWGRGTLDTKNTLMGSLEAAETLCAEGFQPERTVYFAFGGDEETSGKRGARAMAARFADKGIIFDWLLDEGAITGDGIMPGMRKKLSLIGTAEKGYADIVLRARAAGGHASMPPAVTATGRIARAAARVEARPFPLRWLKTTRLFFREITAAASPAVKPVLANLWLTGGLVKLIMARNPSSAALLHTTAAPTIIRGSSKENVLAEDAMAVINVRILPGESVAGTVSRIKKVVGDDKVEVSLLDEEAATEPVKESSVKSEGYRLISEMIEETIADSVVLPFLVTVATDSKYYAGCCRDIYRYVPMILNREELERIHGADERISAENYGLAVNSYKNLIKKL